MSPERQTRPGPLVGGPNPMAERSQRRPRSLLGTLAVVLAPLIVAVVKLLWSSYRFRISGEATVRRFIERGEPLILTAWHESVFVMAWYSLRLVKMGARVTYLVSPSRDGDLVVRMLEVIGGHVVRGSATRSGVRALHGLYRAITKENGSPLLLCDGPQGPRYYCKAGPVLLGQLSDARIVPIGSWPRRAIHLRTWDRAFVPLPLTRVGIVLGEPIAVGSGLSSEEQEGERLALEQRLVELAAQARGVAVGTGEIPAAG